MRYVIFMFLLMLPTLSFGGSYPISDTSKFTEETYNNEKFGEQMSYVTLKKGAFLSNSQLKNSSAKIVNCPSQINNIVLEELSKAEEFANIIPLGDISITECAEISFKTRKYYVASMNLEIKLNNTKKISSDTKFIEPIIYILDPRNRKRPVFYSAISNYRFFNDTMRTTELVSISDVNNDGQHEIILHAATYGGSGYFYFAFKNGRLIRKSPGPGRIWD